MKHAWLRLRYESVDLFWVVVPVVAAVFAQQLVRRRSLSSLTHSRARSRPSRSRSSSPFAHWLIVRPARDHCAANVASAVSAVLDEPLSTPPYVWRRLDTGEIRTLRVLAAAAERGAVAGPRP
jgi:hypothetical protein